MEEAAELGNYLPLSYKSPKEQEYISFLWDAFETNNEHEKYQFAFLAYHMLTMSFVYFNIWQIRQARLEDFKKGLIGFGKDKENTLLKATSPFVFSVVNERTMYAALPQAHRLRQQENRHLRQTGGRPQRDRPPQRQYLLQHPGRARQKDH